MYNPGGTDYSGLSAGTGDIQQDPLFVDRPADDYHLQYTSPCANTGNNSYVQSGWVDMDGEDRIQNGIVDIGADELVVTRIPGDANDDKKVNLQDLSILASYYGQSAGSISVSTPMEVPEPCTAMALMGFCLWPARKYLIRLT